MAQLGTVRIAIAAAAAMMAIGCGRPLPSDNAGSSGPAGSTGVGGAAGASPATDGGVDQSSCVAMCGLVTGAAKNGTCTFPLLCAPPPGFTAMVVLVDYQLVPRDTTGTDGWDYTDASMTAVRLVGQSCGTVEGHPDEVPVYIQYFCEAASPAE
jgi:hypothetical protein